MMRLEDRAAEVLLDQFMGYLARLTPEQHTAVIKRVAEKHGAKSLWTEVTKEFVNYKLITKQAVFRDAHFHELSWGHEDIWTRLFYEGTTTTSSYFGVAVFEETDGWRVELDYKTTEYKFGVYSDFDFYQHRHAIFNDFASRITKTGIQKPVRRWHVPYLSGAQLVDALKTLTIAGYRTLKVNMAKITGIKMLPITVV